jgi:hypothetical protein
METQPREGLELESRSRRRAVPPGRGRLWEEMGRGAMWWGWDNHGRRDRRGALLIGDARGDLQSVVRAEQISILWVDF